MELFKRIFLLVLIVCSTASAFGQGRYKPKNLGSFDKKKYHFGFLLGFNSADMVIDRKASFEDQDSLLSVNTDNQPGFNLGIIGSLNLNKNISIRFIPTLSFEDRALTYVFLGESRPFPATDSTVTFEKRIESTYIDFPINFKFRTDRLGNFAAYAVAGCRYRIDMQSEKDVKNEVAEEILVKTERNDFSVEFGGGFDFFLPYFKFGIEFKMATGVRNLLVPEDTQFSNPIDSMRSRTFLLTLTFEG